MGFFSSRSKKRGHSGIGCAILAIIITAVALAVPWWHISVTYSLFGASCTTDYDVYFDTVTCKMNGNACPSSCSPSGNWRNNTNYSFFLKTPSNTEQTFDIAASFTGFALIVAIVCLVFWICDCCDRGQRMYDFIVLIGGLAGVAFILVAVITFATHLPSSLSNDQAWVCGLYFSDPANGPCSKFYASNSQTDILFTTATWGGIGVWVSLSAVVPFFFLSGIGYFIF